jgi:hypothetical protein
LNIPSALILFNLNFPPYTVFIISISITFFLFFERLYFVKIIAKYNISFFIKNGIVPILIPMIVAIAIASLFHLLMKESFIRLLVVFMSSCLTITLIFRYFGLNNSEFKKIKEHCLEILKIILLFFKKRKFIVEGS